MQLHSRRPVLILLDLCLSLLCHYDRDLCSLNLHHFSGLLLSAFCFSKWYSSETFWAYKPQAQPLGLPSKEYISTRVCSELSCYLN